MSNDEKFPRHPAICEAHGHSKKIIESLRNDLEKALHTSPNKDKLTIVTTGSYGRGEASESSDLDLFLFFDSDKSDDELIEDKKAIKSIVDKYISKQTGDTGTFGSDVVVKFNDMLQNIGGDKDLNKLLTRRMLFLLEGTWLYGEERFQTYRASLITKYIKAGDPDKQISRFLLNDIIRYYRTITTDFEFKVSESQKAWGLRNIKLRFSRKLLYFGGIISVAEVAFNSQSEKNDALGKLFDLTALERIKEIGKNNRHTDEIFDTYQSFLQTIGSPSNRLILENVSKNDRSECALFLEMREKSKSFSQTLDSWLKEQYVSTGQQSHPIHNSLIF